MKIIIFDASTLISFSMNGLLYIIRKLKENSDVKFIVTKEVVYEIIDKPIKIDRFKLEALKLKQLMEEGILEMPTSIGINEKDISEKTNNILDSANSIFKESKQDIHIIDLGEASCVALSKILNEKKIHNVMAIDERTTRMLCERPENLRKLLQKKLHTTIRYEREQTEQFKGLKIIRSSEIVYVAFKKNLTILKGKNSLDALLYALKFKGCAISNDEIEEIKKLN
ncbi:MAG: hypothetical protein KC516_04165 [Nanoarchaeota archaeon]|nr:hypothetical protein [Nanoarchaeota archaeon]